MYRFTFSMLIWISFSSSSWMLLCSFKLLYLSKQQQVVQDLMHVRKFWERQHPPSHCQIGNPSKGTTDAKNNPPMKHHSRQDDCELRTRQPGSQCSLRTLAEWLEPRSWKGGTLIRLSSYSHRKLSETKSPPVNFSKTSMPSWIWSSMQNQLSLVKCQTCAAKVWSSEVCTIPIDQSTIHVLFHRVFPWFNSKTLSGICHLSRGPHSKGSYKS